MPEQPNGTNRVRQFECEPVRLVLQIQGDGDVRTAVIEWPATVWQTVKRDPKQLIKHILMGLPKLIEEPEQKIAKGRIILPPGVGDA